MANFNHPVNFAAEADASDPLRKFRDYFQIPTIAEFKRDLGESVNEGENGNATSSVIYLCTNSLGLPPKSMKEDINGVMSSWQTLGVLSHTRGAFPTETSDIEAKNIFAEYIVGALPSEVAVMESLTSNIHTLLAAFYKPQGKKNKIVIEKNAFPSDFYAVMSQICFRGVDPSSLIEIDICPDQEDKLQTLIDVFHKYKDEIALVWLPGISYLTGLKLDIPRITQLVHAVGQCPVGFDLAHSVGNVELKLHEWNVDFAAWCGYKYLCGSPGGCGGIFVHERHHMSNGEYAPSSGHKYGPALTGWWGHRYSTRFQMTNVMEVEGGADSYRRSCPSMLLNTALTSSLRIFKEVGGVKALVEKSRKLTAYLEELLTKSEDAKKFGLEVITPKSPEERGSQLSIKANVDVEALHGRLIQRGVICDTRKPCYIRLAPFALYNSFQDVYSAARIILEEIKKLSSDA